MKKLMIVIGILLMAYSYFSLFTEIGGFVLQLSLRKVFIFDKSAMIHVIVVAVIGVVGIVLFLLGFYKIMKQRQVLKNLKTDNIYGRKRG